VERKVDSQLKSEGWQLSPPGRHREGGVTSVARSGARARYWTYRKSSKRKKGSRGFHSQGDGAKNSFPLGVGFYRRDGASAILETRTAKLSGSPASRRNPQARDHRQSRCVIGAERHTRDKGRRARGNVDRGLGNQGGGLARLQDGGATLEKKFDRPKKTSRQRCRHRG